MLHAFDCNCNFVGVVTLAFSLYRAQRASNKLPLLNLSNFASQKFYEADFKYLVRFDL